jgi:hypothetical protein
MGLRIGSIGSGRAPALLLAVAAACAGRFGDGGAKRSPPRVVGPEVVRWSAEGPRTLELVLDNPSGRGLDVPDPSHRAAVDVRATGAGGASCQVRPVGPDLPTIHVDAGARLPVTIALGAACGALPPGEYRYDARLDLPPLFDGASDRADPLATTSGLIVVERPRAAVTFPAAPEAIAPPGGSLRDQPQALPRPRDPLVYPGTTGASNVTAECVDRELQRRGLNGYGDPPGTVYPAMPPGGSDRIASVLARYPEIRTTCGVPAPQVGR